MGEVIHVITRRVFEEETRRHFVGEVVATSERALRASGYAFVFDTFASSYVRYPELRTRIFGLGDNGLVINVLPAGTDPASLYYAEDRDGHLTITDGSYSLDINEFGAQR